MDASSIELSEMIETIYAGGETGQWSQLLNRLAASLSGSVAFFAWNPAGSSLSLDSYTADFAQSREWTRRANEFGGSPLRSWYSQFGVGQATTTDGIPKLDWYYRSSYYNEVMPGLEMDRAMLVRVAEQENATLFVCRDWRQPPFGARELATFGVLGPHVARALRLGARSLVCDDARLIQQFDPVSEPAAIVSRDLELLACNVGAERIIGECDALDLVPANLGGHTRLRVSSPALEQRLVAMISMITASAKSCEALASPLSPLTLHTSRTTPSAQLQVGVYPVLADHPVWRTGSRALLRWSVRVDPLHAAVSRIRQLDLTPAEREVCTHLVHGCQPVEIAQIRGTAARTVRNQIQSIFRKTNTSRQAELVAMLLGEGE